MYTAHIHWEEVKGAVWRVHAQRLKPLVEFSAFPLEKLLGIERQKAALVKNTEQFIAGQASNHVLFWGSRGTGKSSLIRALLDRYHSSGLRIIEIPRESLSWLPEISDELRLQPYRFIIFCDDLSFESGESGYKGLKSIMEGSLETPPENIKVYATSNRRHLVPEYMSDNQQATVGERGEIHLSDSVEERISLADRFGLSLSFYSGNLNDYLALVDSYFEDYEGDKTQLAQEARRFAQARASYSGRTAQQFYNFKGSKIR